MNGDTPIPAPERLVIHEGSFILPSGFEDRTANVLVPSNLQTQPNLSVARDWLETGESLTDYIDRQVVQLKNKLPGHQVKGRQSEHLGSEQPVLGERLDATYKNGTRLVYQRQAAFLIASRRVLIFSAASAMPFNQTSDTLWRQWLDSVLLNTQPTAWVDPIDSEPQDV